MGIRNKKLMQLLRKISSSQVEPGKHNVLQQRVGDITYYTMSSFLCYTAGSWAILKVTLAFLGKA